MVNGFDEFAQERLKQAESAEKEVQRLEGLAAEAPQLRLAKAKAERAEERQRNKDGAMSKALDATLIAAEKQERVPAMLKRTVRPSMSSAPVTVERNGIDVLRVLIGAYIMGRLF